MEFCAEVNLLPRNFPLFISAEFRRNSVLFLTEFCSRNLSNKFTHETLDFLYQKQKKNLKTSILHLFT
jgi:hypothetical protein